MIKAYITNLGKYNEGYLFGEYLKFPATTEDVQALLKRIKIDKIRYEEIFITDYETDVDNLKRYLGEDDNINELNYLENLIEYLDADEVETFEAVLSYKDHTHMSTKDLINLTQNLNCFELFTHIENEEALGLDYTDAFCDLPDWVNRYLDHEAIGRDILINDGGTFTDKGYLEETDANFIEYYKDINDLPDEYKIFAYPKNEEE